MGRRSRARRVVKLRADDVAYADADGNVLVLRGSMTAPTRQQYAAALHDQDKTIDDAWQRAVEFLFERLAVRWVVHDVPTEGQKRLLERYRMASQDERRWVRDTVREHVADHFPELEAP